LRSKDGNRNIKKGDQHLLHERQEKFRFMKQHKLKYPVELMYKVLNASKSGYLEFDS